MPSSRPLTVNSIRSSVDVVVSPLQALLQRSARLAEAQHSAQAVQTERAAARECLWWLQRTVATLETEKGDAERQVARLERDKSALRNTLDKVDSLTTLPPDRRMPTHYIQM